jgi:hypothetical protein
MKGKGAVISASAEILNVILATGQTREPAAPGAVVTIGGVVFGAVEVRKAKGKDSLLVRRIVDDAT